MHISLSVCFDTHCEASRNANLFIGANPRRFSLTLKATQQNSAKNSVEIVICEAGGVRKLSNSDAVEGPSDLVIRNVRCEFVGMDFFTVGFLGTCVVLKVLKVHT